MRNVDKLARAIAIAEGYQSRGGAVLDLAPARRNNPGSLRASSFPNEIVNGYAVFPDAATGWRALYRQIALDRDRDLTVERFVYKFAPPSENRTEEYYLPLVLAETGLRRGDKLGAWVDAYPPRSPILPEGLPGVTGALPASAPPVVLSSFPALPSLDDVPIEWAIGGILAAVAAFLYLRS